MNFTNQLTSHQTSVNIITLFFGLAYYQGKDIVFRFIVEYNSSLRDFGA